MYLVESGQPQVSAPTVGVIDSVVAFVIALWTLLDQLPPLYGLTDAYCAPASVAWLTRICCEKARPRSTSGVSAARNTGAASPNSTADMPRRSRSTLPIQAGRSRNAARNRPDRGWLHKERLVNLKDIPRPPMFGAARKIGRSLLTNREGA